MNGAACFRPEHDVVAAVVGAIERGLQRDSLRLGALGQRRDPADRRVPGGELGQLLVGRRTAAADVGVVRQDLVGRSRRAVRHQHHGGSGLAHRVVCVPDAIDDCLEHVGIGVRLHAVAEVEDVARMRLPSTEPLSASTASVPATATSTPASTSAGSRLPCTTRSAPIRRRASVIDVRQSRPSTLGPGGVHRLEQVVAADAEVDARHAGVTGGERGEHRGGVGEHERVVVGAAERAGPRVEQLEGAGAVVELAGDRRSRMLDEALHQLVPQHRLGVHQPLGVLVRAARPALDEVAGHGERRAGEGEQRHRLGKLGGEDVDRLAARTACRSAARTVGGGSRSAGSPDRRLAHRAGAGGDIDAEPDRVGGNDDVAVQHGRVDAVAAHRLQGELGGEVRLLDGVEDAALAAHGPVLGKTATRLTHEPHRGVRATTAVGCQEERRDRHASRTLQREGGG